MSGIAFSNGPAPSEYDEDERRSVHTPAPTHLGSPVTDPGLLYQLRVAAEAADLVGDTKPTNPKDAIGAGKLPLHLVPDTATYHLATAFLEGALKYGKYNWRVAGVRASIYLDALDRHVSKWKNGEDRDPKTRVHHLANALACIAIILDAELCGKLTDDRPPRANIAALEADLTARAAHLRELFKDHNPHQYTIADGD